MGSTKDEGQTTTTPTTPTFVDQVLVALLEGPGSRGDLELRGVGLTPTSLKRAIHGGRAQGYIVTCPPRRRGARPASNSQPATRSRTGGGGTSRESAPTPLTPVKRGGRRGPR